ncbi:Ig-like domain-containing protein [Comamonas sp. GB3 AK4-5]|uniref:Ig-like domain-containing protein n=1 Tax=Comamonas sp. GB3 AK4-5 TaxID=3231487 RepID=UPI00351DF599
MTTPHKPFWRRWMQASTASNATLLTGKTPNGPVSAMRPLALEQRFMFDGAGAVDAVHAAHAVADGVTTTTDAAADTTSALRHALMAEVPAADSQRQEVVVLNATGVNPPILVSATFSDSALKIGETSTVTFVFSTAVTSFTTADLTTPNGQITSLSSGDGGTTWTGTFTPNAGVTDSTNVITVDLSGVTSVSGGFVGSGTADSSNYAIDTLAPSVSSVSATTANGSYVAGQSVDITVNFNDNVTVSGTPQLTLETGSSDRVVNYLSGSGTNTLTFRYTIQAGDTSLDLDYVNSNALTLNGGAIRDSAGNDATLTLAAPGTAGSLGANKAIVIDSAPSISNLSGDSVAWPGAGNTVTLDVASNATLSDAEFGALNSGNGNWSGGSLTVQRAGTAASADVFGFNTSGALFTVSGGNLQSNGLTFATFTSTGGVLAITFTSSGTTATTALAQDVLQRITYRNDTPAGDATIRFSVNDGISTTTADVTVASDTIYVTNAIDTSTIDVSDGVSFSEAIAIAAADITGKQTIVIDASLAGQTVSISAATALNENLTLDLGLAHGVTLAGGSLAIGAGFNLEVVIGSGNTATIAATLTNLGSFTKSGAGTLTLSGANTYTGTTTVSAGVLELNGGLALSNNNSVSVSSGAELKVSNSEEIGALSGSGTVRVSTSQTLTVGNVVSSIFSGSLTGNGGLTVSQTMGNTNTLTLNGDNTGLGAQIRVINYGRLIVDGENAIGDNTSVTVNSNAIFTLSSNQTIGSLASNLSTASIQLGSFTLTVGGNHTSTTVSGVISGTGSLVKQGSGTLTLDSGSNSYSGGTTLSAGVLSVQAGGALGSGAITFNGGAMDIGTTTPLTFANMVQMTSAGTIRFIEDAEATFSGAFTGSGALTVTGAAGGAREVLTLSNSANSAGWSGTMTATNATFQVAADSMLSSGSITLNNGSVLLTTAATTIDNAVNIGGAAILYSNSGALVLSGVVSGSGALTTGGTVGTSVTLSGSNTHSGSVTVAAGKLILSGGSAVGDTSAVTISNSSTLELAANETIGSLAGTSGTILTLGSNALTIGGNNSNTTFAGSIGGTGGGLTKIGSGTLTLSGINTNTGAIQISAGGLTVSGGSAIANTASVTVSSGATFTLSTNETIGSLAGAGTVELGSSTLSSGSTGVSTTFSGTATGTGNLTKTGSGTLTLSGTNSYTNTTVSGGGTVSITDASNIGTGTITIGNGSILLVTGDNVTLSNNFTSAAGGGKISNANAVTLSGVVSGGSLFTKEGAGVLTLSAANTLNGGTEVSAGTLMLTGSLTATNHVTVMSGATLAGTGTITAVTTVTVASGATLAPGITGVNNGVGTLTINGNLVMASGSTLAVDINGSTAGSGYDQVIVNGTVSVSGATLAASHSYTASNGDTYRIVDNDAADGTTGTFSGMAEGSTLTAAGNGTVLTGSYIGGDGNDFTLTAPVAPVVTGVSSSTANGTYKIGDVVTITVTFDTTVWVTGIPQLQLETGATDHWLDYVSGSGTDTLTFSYTVQAGDSSADLDYVSSSALVLNGGTIRSGANTDALLNLANPGAAGSLGGNKALVIDGVRPTATIVVANGNMGIGSTSLVTITFSEAVAGFTNADLTVDNGTLSAVSSGDGGITWTATFAPAAGISNATNVIRLNNSGVTDMVGNGGSGSTDSNNYVIDQQPPTATSIVPENTSANSNAVSFTVTFSEDVSGVDRSDFSLVPTGSASGQIASVLQINARTYTVHVQGLSGEGTVRLDLNSSGTGIVDQAGNAIVGGIQGSIHYVDCVAPAVTSVNVPANGTYIPGQNLDFTVNFSENVAVDTTSGTPRIAVTLDTGGTVYANYVSGSGSSALVFRMTVASGQLDSNGISLGSAVQLNGGSIRDTAGNDTVVTLNSVASTTEVHVDGVVPEVASVTVPADGSYKAGDVLTFTVNASESVLVDTQSGTPRLRLDVGGSTRYASYVSGSGSAALVFTYIVQAGDNDGDGIALAGTLDLNGGAVRDAAGNPLAMALNAVGATAGIVVDTTAPTASLSLDKSLLNAQGTAQLTVRFSEAVTGLTTADFTVANGTLSNLRSADGGITWTATFTPNADITGGTNLITLNNTAVTDLAGNAGSGTTDSNNYAIDTERPTATITVADSSLIAGQTSQVTITFSEAVTGLTTTDFTVANGTLSNLRSADGGITWTATFTPTAGITGGTNLITLDNTGVQDGAGNTGMGTTSSNSYAIDTVLPDQPVLQVESNVEGKATVRVDALVAGGHWEYSLDGGQTWAAGQGNSVILQGAGVYALQVRQSSAVGNMSTASLLSIEVFPVVVPPTVAWPSFESAWGGSLPGAFGASTGASAWGLGGEPPAESAGSHTFFALGNSDGRVWGTSGLSSFFSGGVASENQELSHGFLGVGHSGAGVFGASTLSGLFGLAMPESGKADPGPVVRNAVDALEAGAGQQVDWQVPPTLFGHSDPLASVQLSMTQADGRALPAWLKFDARTGKLTGTMPEGFRGELVLRLTARDSQGHAVHTPIKLKAAEAAPVARTGVAEQLQHAAQLRAGQMTAQRLHI